MVVSLSLLGARRRWFATYPADTMMILRDHSKEVFLVGTAHVSKSSANQVVEVIQNVQPDVVVLELDETRAKKLRTGRTGGSSSPPRILSVLGKSFHGGHLFETLIRILYQMFERLGMEPGAEFVAAMQECEKRRIPVVFGDQDVSVTMAKIQKVFSMQDFMRILAAPPKLTLSREEEELIRMSSAPEDFVEKLKTRENVRILMRLMRSIAPEVANILVDERDVVLADSIKKANGKRVVAVVGMAHMDGISRAWDKQ